MTQSKRIPRKDKYLNDTQRRIFENYEKNGSKIELTQRLDFGKSFYNSQPYAQHGQEQYT